MLSRRDLLRLAGPSALATVLPLPFPAKAGTAPDYRIDIAPITLELSDRHRVRTTAYNGQVPGPLLRFKENQPVTIQVDNRSDRPEVVHWHGLWSSPEVDGAVEEGTPFIAPNSSARFTLTPRPSGFRWYHTHTMALNDFTRGQYSGQHGFILIEPRQDPAPYDREFFLALHDWSGYLLASDDGAMNPSYSVATINARAMGSGEPLRVKQGQRILLQVLNSSPTEVHWLALAGHSLRVIALDGNPVPTPRIVPMLRLAPAERASVLVEMNNPGVWILGEVRKHVQALGMAVVVEYAGQGGAPAWSQPSELRWNYAQFAAPAAAESADATTVSPTAPVHRLPIVIESQFRGHGSM
jgi:FtsP/CotA-like multicopper oxidase with cupredoxin domain